MGCGTSCTNSVVWPFGKNRTSFLSEFNVVWFDPNISNPENSGYRSALEKMFATGYYVELVSKVKAAIEDSEQPLICISSGRFYEDIMSIVENEGYVAAVLIFCNYPQNYMKYKGGKVKDIINNFEHLEASLQSVHAEYKNFSLAFNITGKTFYDKSDADLIKSLAVEINGDKFSIFYPLGVDSNLENQLTKSDVRNIKEAAKADKELTEDERRDVGEVLDELELHRNMPGVLRSYLNGKLYKMMNRCFRGGNVDSLRLFKSYLFSLKASMCEKGLPITKETTLYRVFRFSEEAKNEYLKNQGKLVLLPSFMTMMRDMKKARKFVKTSGKGTSTELHVTLVPFEDSFADFLTEFHFPEENGVYFPVDISTFGDRDTDEVVFPPFYPLRITKVVPVHGACIIQAQAPYYVNLAGKDARASVFKEMPKSSEGAKAYLESILRLSGKKVMDKISVGTSTHRAWVVKLEMIRNGQFDQFASVIKQLPKLKRLSIGTFLPIRSCHVEYEFLKDAHVATLMDIGILKSESLEHLSLGNNRISEKSATVLAEVIREGRLRHLDLCILHIISSMNRPQQAARSRGCADRWGGEGEFHAGIPLAQYVYGVAIGRAQQGRKRRSPGAQLSAEGEQDAAGSWSGYYLCLKKVGDNEVGDVGAVSLAQALAVNHGLKELDLGNGTNGRALV